MYGVMAEFDTAEQLLSAGRRAREAGYRRMDAYAPFPVEGLAEALGFRTNAIPLIGLTGGVVGALTGWLMQVWIHTTALPINVAHFHYIMVGGMVTAYMGGLHYWRPKITGRMYSEMWGRIAAVVIFLGFNLTFFPQYILGYLGMPRRYHIYPPDFQTLNVMSTAGASILAIGYVMPLIYLLASLRKGRIAGDNPWDATGLEWQTSSPPPKDNFAEVPVATGPPYDYVGRVARSR